jgi:hypothetical protein
VTTESAVDTCGSDSGVAAAGGTLTTDVSNVIETTLAIERLTDPAIPRPLVITSSRSKVDRP